MANDVFHQMRLDKELARDYPFLHGGLAKAVARKVAYSELEARALLDEIEIISQKGDAALVEQKLKDLDLGKLKSGQSLKQFARRNKTWLSSQQRKFKLDPPKENQDANQGKTLGMCKICWCLFWSSIFLGFLIKLVQSSA